MLAGYAFNHTLRPTEIIGSNSSKYGYSDIAG